MECMRQYIGEVLDFIADMHTLTKLKVSIAFRHISSNDVIASFGEFCILAIHIVRRTFRSFLKALAMLYGRVGKVASYNNDYRKGDCTSSKKQKIVTRVHRGVGTHANNVC